MASPPLLNLPHQPPMVMVDRVLSRDEQSAITSFSIQAENIFLTDGALNESGLIENMAQSMAALLDSVAPEGENEPKIAFVGAVKNLQILDHPLVGQLLETQVTIRHKVFNALIAWAETRCENRLLASCELTLYIQDKP
jgi:predicted hotdog family 3-hydroxylacyl-ACP dehydratase